ncbi:MAG: hypothetical protein JRJ00_15025 [Deltaproteobacteria bacterium]|nr:hypothetical protein [Deltaproteobacteria bacterium]
MPSIKPDKNIFNADWPKVNNLAHIYELICTRCKFKESYMLLDSKSEGFLSVCSQWPEGISEDILFEGADCKKRIML